MDPYKIRSILMACCLISILFITLRQLFDFLGRLWLPMLANFLQIIITITVYFGVLQYRKNCIIIYSIWTTTLWLGWNIFLICFYLNIGYLDRNLHTGIFHFWSLSIKNAKTFWYKNTPFCEKFYNSTSATVEVKNCLLDYYYVEVICAIVHLILAFLIIVGCLIFVTIFRKKFCKTSSIEVPRRNKNYKRPLVTVEYNGIPKTGMQATAAHCCPTQENSLDKLLHPLPDKNSIRRESKQMTNNQKSDNEDTFHRRKVNGTRQSVMVPNYKRAKNDGNAAKCRRNSLPSHSRKNDANPIRSTIDFQGNKIVTEKFAGQTVTIEFSHGNEIPTLPADVRTGQTSVVNRISSPRNDEEVFKIPDYRIYQDQCKSTDVNRSSYQSFYGPTTSNRCSSSTVTEGTVGDRSGRLFTFNPKNEAPSEIDGHSVAKSRGSMGISSIEELLNANMPSMQQRPDRFSYDSSSNSAAYKSNVDTTSRNSQSYGVHYGQNQQDHQQLHHHHHTHQQGGLFDDNCWPSPPPKMMDYYVPQSNDHISSSNNPMSRKGDYSSYKANILASSSFPAGKECLSSSMMDKNFCGTRFSRMKDKELPILSVKDLVV